MKMTKIIRRLTDTEVKSYPAKGNFLKWRAQKKEKITKRNSW